MRAEAELLATGAKLVDSATDKNSYMEEVHPQTQQLEQTRRPSISQTQILVWKRGDQGRRRRWRRQRALVAGESTGKIVIHLTEFNAFATDINHCDAQDRTAANRNRTEANQTMEPKVERSGVLMVSLQWVGSTDTVDFCKACLQAKGAWREHEILKNWIFHVHSQREIRTHGQTHTDTRFIGTLGMGVSAGLGAWRQRVLHDWMHTWLWMIFEKWF